MIRKTVSVGTLGIVSFRSKKEKLQRAERSQHDAEAALEREHSARVAAEALSISAERRVKKARSEAAHAERKARKRSRSHRKSDKLAAIVASAEPIVRGGVETARHTGSDVAKRGRRAGRHARKAAKHAAHDAKKAAKRSAADARKAAERGRKVGRRARRAAEHTAHDAKKAAERTLQHAGSAMSDD